MWMLTIYYLCHKDEQILFTQGFQNMYYHLDLEPVCRNNPQFDNWVCISNQVENAILSAHIIVFYS